MLSKKKINLLSLVFVLMLMLFGGIMFVSYATDTYATIGALTKTAQGMIIRNGRPVIALSLWLCDMLGITDVRFLMASNITAFLMIGAAVYVFALILGEYIDDVGVTALISTITVANLYIIEYFMFMEKGAMMFGIFMALLAVYFEHRHLAAKGQQVIDRYVLYSWACLLTSTLTYQTAANMYIILCIPFIYRYSSGCSKYCVNVIRIFAAFGVTYVLDALILKCTGSARMTLGINIKYPLTGLVDTTIHTFKIIPAGVYLVVLLFALGLNLWDIAKHSENKVKAIGGLAFLFAVSNLFPIFTIFLTNGWYTPRIVYPLGSCAGILLINYFVNGNTAFIAERKKSVICAVVVILLIFQFFGFSRIYIDKYVANRLDEYRIAQIEDSIKEYELNSGNKIKQIAVYRDSSPSSRQQYFSDLYNGGDLIVSSFVEEWSDVNAINYYLGSDYKKVDCSKSVEEKFSKQNWDVFSSDQLFFENETLHMCVY